MRIKKLQKKLKEKEIDLAIFFSLDEKPNTNIIYFTGYSGIGLLAVLKNKHFLLVPEMEFEKANKTKNKIYKTDKKKRLLENLVNLTKRQKIKRIGIEEGNCSVYMYKKLKKAINGRYLDVSSVCSEIRMVKDKEELKNIQTACKVTDNVFSKLCKDFNFKTENELKKFIEQEIKNNGCELAFPPIVASGKNSSQAHYDSNSKIKKGFLMLDFGAKYKRYCSDMTRMLYIGKPSKQEKEAHNFVFNCVKVCEIAAEKTNRFSKLYDVAVKFLDKDSEYFTHALGHGLGLDIHERPSLYSEDKNKIQDNVTFTIEPGIYYPNKYGIRIEDTVVMKNKKLKILTKSKKELVIIK